MMSKMELLSLYKTLPYPIKEVEDLYTALPEEKRNLETMTNIFDVLQKTGFGVYDIIPVFWIKGEDLSIAQMIYALGAKAQ
jgi:hypothetical protein